VRRRVAAIGELFEMMAAHPESVDRLTAGELRVLLADRDASCVDTDSTRAALQRGHEWRSDELPSRLE
jgi:hypothetical protein